MIFPRSQGESWAPILMLFCYAIDKTGLTPGRSLGHCITEVSLRMNTPVSLLKLTALSGDSESPCLLRRPCEQSLNLKKDIFCKLFKVFFCKRENRDSKN